MKREESFMRTQGRGLAKVLTMLALMLLVTTGAWAQTETYTVRMKKGTKDAANWTITPDEATTTGVPAETAVTLKYSGRMKVKGVTAKTYDPMQEIPLTIEALTGGTIKLIYPKVGMKYKTDNGDLVTITSTEDVTIDLPTGGKVAFYGNGKEITNYYDPDNSKGTMIAPGTTNPAKVKVYGNIMSLVDENDFVNNTTLTDAHAYAFSCLFDSNDMLLDASGLRLPATTLSNSCYWFMFSSCVSLSAAPELPATTLAKSCYYHMFRDCKKLTTAPELPATTLVNYCYNGMFMGCSALEAAPELPATTLAPYCYSNMFNGCYALEAAPALPAETLVEGCYLAMFTNCTSLQSVTCLATSGLDNLQTYTNSWLEGVPQTGTFIKAKDANWPSGESGIPEGWTVKLSPLTTPLTMEALTDGTIKVESPKVGMKYKKNNGALSTVNSTDDVTIDVQEGDKVEFYGNGTSITCYKGTYIAGGTAEVKVYGNIMSLVNEQNYPTAKELTEQYALCGLFGNNTTLKDASGLLLPATTLADECYEYLFAHCTALTAAPDLPATTLANACYAFMFSGCTALTAAPKVLPAKTLAENCYEGMFLGCEKLTTAPELKAETLDYNCCHQMFQGCIELTDAPELKAETLASNCYCGMFEGCSALEAAPELPATTLAPNCYQDMFKDCIELTTSPVLRATMLASSCYSSMFYGCSKLNTVICLATDVSADNCFGGWLLDVSSLGTLYVSADLASDDVPKMLDGSSWDVMVYVAPDD